MFSGKVLRERRKSLGWTQRQVAEQVGIHEVSYSAWETGKTQPNKANISKLAKLLEVTPAYFESQYKLVENYLRLTESNQGKLVDYSEELLIRQEEDKVRPLYVIKVLDDIELSAGLGESLYNTHATVDVYAEEEYSYDIATWIKGDSMEPSYHNGEVALIRESSFDYDGAVYAIQWNERVYIKKVYKEADGYRLVSLNPQYADLFAAAEDHPRIVGKIVGNFMPVEV